MGILEICGNVFNCPNDRGTQVIFIGWKSEMPNVLKWEKVSYTTKNCPASGTTLECCIEQAHKACF